MKTYSTGSSILTRVNSTFIYLIFTILSFIAIHTLAEVITKSIVNACGIVHAGSLTLAWIQICENIPSHDMWCVHVRCFIPVAQFSPA